MGSAVGVGSGVSVGSVGVGSTEVGTMVGAVAVLVPSGVVVPSRATWETQAMTENSRKMIPDNHRAGLSFNKGSPDRDNDWP